MNQEILCSNCNRGFKPESEKDDLCSGCMYDLVEPDEDDELEEIED